MEIGTIRKARKIEFRPDCDMELLRAGTVGRAWRSTLFIPPIHLVIHPDEPIRSLEAAAKVVRRHAGDRSIRQVNSGTSCICLPLR